MFGFAAVGKKESEAPYQLRVPRSNTTSPLSIDDLTQQIKQHDIGVRKNPRDRVCYRTVCAGCGKNAPFASHGLRQRGLRYIVDNSVVCSVIWLARWRCRGCGRTFTDHPDFRLAL
jgi:rRNA maturation endonuclease Nob1